MTELVSKFAFEELSREPFTVTRGHGTRKRFSRIRSAIRQFLGPKVARSRSLGRGGGAASPGLQRGAEAGRSATLPFAQAKALFVVVVLLSPSWFCRESITTGSTLCLCVCVFFFCWAYANGR